MSAALIHDCPTGKHPQPHYSCYHGHGCRCVDCKDAAVEDNRRRRRDRAYGRWRARRVDAASTRALLAMLRDAGSTQAWVTEQTGLAPKTQWEIRTRRREHVHRSTAVKVERLARLVAAGEAHPPNYVDARRRQIQREERRAYRVSA